MAIMNGSCDQLKEVCLNRPLGPSLCAAQQCTMGFLGSTEYHMWIRKWKQDSPAVPAKLVDALQACDRWTFPNIRVLLQLALTIPVTSSEVKEALAN